MKREKSGNAKVNESANGVSNPKNEKLLKSGLREAKRNMYDFVTHTWNPIKGKCEHECAYCYVSKLVKNQKPIRLDEKEMKTDLESNHFIFVGSGTDVFAKGVSSEWITKVLDYCNRFENKYLFQTKNPERFIEFIEHPVFKKSVICTTIESNRPYADCKAPKVEDRVSAIELLKSDTDIEVYVTVEPIMDFDTDELVDLLKRCEPAQVNIGADSKGAELTEPSCEKISELINRLSPFTTVNKKKNLKRLMKIENPMEKELKQAKKEIATSILMKVQIMEEVKNGYTIKEKSRKFGLVRENRPIKDADVNGFMQMIQNGEYDKTQSIQTMEATDLIENYNITDFEGNPISEKEAKDYLIVLDGQHRICAFAKLNASRTPENQVEIPHVYIRKDIKNVREFLAKINLVGHNWSITDKTCVSAITTGSKVLDKVHELISKGFMASTAMTIYLGYRLTPKQLDNILDNGDIECLPQGQEEADAIERAERFVTTAMGITNMSVKILKKRYFIDGFNSFATARTEEEAFEALGKLTINDFGKNILHHRDFIKRLNAALQ